MSHRRALGVLAIAFLAACGGASGKPTAAGTDWRMFGFGPARSNSGPASTGITAANVSHLSRRQVQLDGTVDSSAIYLHDVRVRGRSRDVFFVTTTYGKTDAIDAASGSVLWRYTPAGYASWAGSYRITNATPVADPSRASIYAASPDGRIQKLRVSDGHALWRTAITLLPAREKITSSLNLVNGRVLATTGGYIGDQPPYQGHLTILDARSGKVLHVWNSLCSDRTGLIVPNSCASSDSAIWGRAGAVVEPGTGALLVATGNAHFDGTTDWGDSLLRLSSAAHLLGSWTPTNAAELDSTDLDLGSTSPAWVGGGLAVQGGKDGKLRLVDVRHLSLGKLGGELQTVATPGGTDLFTAPAVWRSGGVTWVFVGSDDGLDAWRLRGRRLVRAWSVSAGSTSPVVAGGLLYVYDRGGSDVGLHVYRPATGRLVATLPAGLGHWSSPIVVDGRIALPEGDANEHATSGVLDIYRP